jgi:uncharacterized coiled-coil protein SlyX
LGQRNLERRIAAVELSLREQEALLRRLEKRLADPAEHIDREASARLAAEYAVRQREIDGLMAAWEELLKAREDA